jgi:hypothetical protein
VRKRVVREEESVSNAPLVVLEGGGNRICQLEIWILPLGREVHGSLRDVKAQEWCAYEVIG